MPNSSNCLCDSNITYSECCNRFHTGTEKPQTAELLMRARFTAYAMRNVDFLLSTWDKNKRPKEIDFSKEPVEWVRLEIINTKKGLSQDNKGIVEFKAFYLLEGEEHVMREVSRFHRKDGKWLYLEGIVHSIAKAHQQPSGNLNALCSCGSGKKFKRCCGQSLIKK